MQTINIQLNRSQFLKSIRKMDEKDKLAIYEELKHSLFPKRFEKLLKSTQSDEISFDEITKEVEDVRQQRYEEGKQGK